MAATARFAPAVTIALVISGRFAPAIFAAPTALTGSDRNGIRWVAVLLVAGAIVVTSGDVTEGERAADTAGARLA